MSKNILIVEDEPTLSKVLSESLVDAGFTISKALNGKEGLDMALKDHPDMILLDIIMPVMDGITMLKKLREDSWGKTAKVIILTNLSESNAEGEESSKDASAYLIKSDWKLEDIVKKVNKELGISE